MAGVICGANEDGLAVASLATPNYLGITLTQRSLPSTKPRFRFTNLLFNQPVFLSDSSRWRTPTFQDLRALVDEASRVFANMAGGGILPIKFTELLQVRSHSYSKIQTFANELLVQLTNVGIAVCFAAFL